MVYPWRRGGSGYGHGYGNAWSPGPRRPRRYVVCSTCGRWDWYAQHKTTCECGVAYAQHPSNGASCPGEPAPAPAGAQPPEALLRLLRQVVGDKGADMDAADKEAVEKWVGSFEQQQPKPAPAAQGLREQVQATKVAMYQKQAQHGRIERKFHQAQTKRKKLEEELEEAKKSELDLTQQLATAQQEVEEAQAKWRAVRAAQWQHLPNQDHDPDVMPADISAANAIIEDQRRRLEDYETLFGDLPTNKRQCVRERGGDGMEVGAGNPEHAAAAEAEALRLAQETAEAARVAAISTPTG